MYHCYINFYLVGHQGKAFETIKEMPALEHFTHEFSQGKEINEQLFAESDVILANLEGMDRNEIQRLLRLDKKKDAELILFAVPDQIPLLKDNLSGIKDIWTAPMSEMEVEFRFFRWQQNYKNDRDFWQTSQYLEATINHTPNLIWYKTKDGIHEKVNESFCKTVNKTMEQVEGRGHAYIWDVEHDDPSCIESEREVMTKKKTYVSEETIQTGGGLRQLTTYKSPLYDLDGSVMGTVGVAIDVTQERKYEREISRKNDTLERMFKTLECGVIRHSLDGSRILSINSAALKILGYESQNDLLADGFDTVAGSVLDEDKPKLRKSIQSLKKEGDSVGVEYRVRHRNGKMLHILGNVKLLEENGEMIYQRFLLDFTAQKQQEKENEKRHMELVQALSIDYSLVCFFDLDTGEGTLLQNDGDDRDWMDRIFGKGLPFTESMKRYIEKNVYEDDRELMYQVCDSDYLKQKLSEQKLYCINYRISKGNEQQYFQMKVVRTGALDENYGIVFGLRSVDEEIRYEMEQKNLLEDALMQANRASKAKSVFLSNMSHDIRTPMNAVVGFANLAVRHIDNKDQVEEYLKKITTSGNHLLSLINDVLDMSRIESGKVRLEEKPCSLPDILHGLRNMIQADVHAKQLEMYFDTVDVLDEEIYCDKLRLNQVFLNLLGNSIKYTGAGGSVSMRITEKAGAPDGYADYEFQIKDTGIGMSEEFVSHIFEPFERESNTTISGIQGTGLGMAITKNIVDMMNGTITVKSRQNVGTEFTVCFRFRLYSDAKEPQIITELKDCRALVVDDDFNTCDSVSYMLGQMGMRAEWTLSGKEAVLRTHQAIMRENDYRIYIIDWLLPDMNGIEVTRRIRTEIDRSVPIIVLTAYDWSDIEEEAREAGVTAFCSKPLFLSELRNCLNSVVNKVESEEAESKSSIRHHTGRILLAEDIEVNQEIATAILGDAGFLTEVAGNGQIALDMLKNSRPGYYQVVLMDIQMPVMNGYEAAKNIRSLPDKALASIPIIAMTANAFEEDKQEAIKCGMNAHISKPIDIDKLFDTLDRVLIKG